MGFRASDSAVVHGFQAFYYELLRQKERALSLYFAGESYKDPEVEEKAEDKDEGLYYSEDEALASKYGSNKMISSEADKKPNEIEGAIVTIQKGLKSAIELTTETMAAKSRLPIKFVNEAKYVMTVLADEVFINLRWEGARFWRFSLLEKQLFQSEIAGEKFFSSLDRLLENINSTNEELAFLYLMSLSLGFKGKYRDSDSSKEHISWYKDRLYSIFHNKPSRLFYPGRGQLINSCYESTVLDDSPLNLPDVKFWSWCIISVIFVYIIVSFGIWHSITGEISDVLHKISEQVRNGPLI